MRRFGRILLNAATVVSLLLCLTTAVLWVRSYTHFVEYRHVDRENGRLLDFVVLYGGVQIAKVENVPSRSGERGWEWGHGWSSFPLRNPPRSLSAAPRKDWQLFFGAGTRVDQSGFGFRRLVGDLGNAGSPFWSIRVPLWAIALTFATLPIWTAFRWRRHTRRTRRGLCPACSYDLRATPDRCPECGRVPQGVSR